MIDCIRLLGSPPKIELMCSSDTHVLPPLPSPPLHYCGSISSAFTIPIASLVFAGFSVIQWWASVGIVACYWSAGEDSHAEDYYSCIEALSGDGAAVPSTLQLAFKANAMHKRPSENLQAPLEVILQLCAATSTSLKSCVTDLLQDNTSSTETELHQVSVLL